MLERVGLMSPALRASVDKMCCQAVFCSSRLLGENVIAKHLAFFDTYVRERHTGENALKQIASA